MSSKNLDLWSLPLLFMWAVFFVIGLFPAIVFELMRAAGAVVTQSALVNSPLAVTLSLAVYLGVFGFNRCQDAGLHPFEAAAKAFFLFVVGLVGFLNYPLFLLMSLPEGLTPADEYKIYVLGAAKAVSWLYLYITMLRYNAFGDPAVFASLFSHTRSNTPPATPIEEEAEPGLAKAEGE